MKYYELFRLFRRNIVNRFSMKYSTFFFIILFVMVSISAALETITLDDNTEISYAIAVNEAIDRLSGRMRDCIENNNGKTEGCICID
jgi:hypothetical protein